MYQGSSRMQPDAMGSSSGGAYAGSGGMDPMTAGMMVGGSFLSNYLAQRAQEEENRKKMMVDAAKTQGQQEQGALGQLMSAYRAALGG